MHVRSDRHERGRVSVGRNPIEGKCSTVGCTRSIRANGMCKNCYNKARLARIRANRGDAGGGV